MILTHSGASELSKLMSGCGGYRSGLGGAGSSVLGADWKGGWRTKPIELAEISSRSYNYRVK
jgi:hypothetical protein